MPVTAYTVYKPGQYLHNNTSLYYVVRQAHGQLLLEDASHPDLPLMELSARELREGKWQVVKREEAA